MYNIFRQKTLVHFVKIIKNLKNNLVYVNDEKENGSYPIMTLFKPKQSLIKPLLKNLDNNFLLSVKSSSPTCWWEYDIRAPSTLFPSSSFTNTHIKEILTAFARFEQMKNRLFHSNP